MDKLTIYKDQLNRMRSMNRYYHDQFLLDVRILFILNTIFLYLSFENDDAFYLLPLISLFGSVLLSFHAYFLIFSRQYTEFIETRINNEFDKEILIAHKLENEYFFPINDKKIVVAILGKGFTWFSFVTLFITTYGIGTFLFSSYQIYNKELGQGYFYMMIGLLFITIFIGVWWFVSGTGEQRLKKVFDNHGS
tara:strand:- start:383 stop:961 length:579 start_codon:yes stop_codon:yes gene_type:complete